MNVTRTLATLAAFAATTLLFAAPACAQASRTWVSGVGNDANPCSRTAPCQTFAGAIAKTATGGEIDCLDPGGFGALSIAKAITIDCSAAGNVGGVLVSILNGVTVSITPGTGVDTHVQLIGLHINGLGTGTNGVGILGASNNVAIINCVIYGFRSSPTSAGVFVSGAGAKAIVENSVIRLNNNGVVLTGTGATAQVDNTVLDANLTANLNMHVTGTKAFLNHSTLTGSAAISNSVTPVASVISTGANFISGVGAPTSTIPLE